MESVKERYKCHLVSGQHHVSILIVMESEKEHGSRRLYPDLDEEVSILIVMESVKEHKLDPVH